MGLDDEEKRSLRSKVEALTENVADLEAENKLLRVFQCSNKANTYKSRVVMRILIYHIAFKV